MSLQLVSSETVLLFPVYAPDMPKRLPIQDLVVGLLRGILRAVRYWLHYTLVALAWLGIVPLTACKYAVTARRCQPTTHK